ncbi:MAG: ATP-binding protein [Bacteroides sp.]|nr:ATP-binding protein [Bacteroides sp.]
MESILRNSVNAERLLKLTSNTLLLIDKDGVCIDAVINNTDLWFLKEENLVGKNLRELLPSTTYQQIYPEFQKVLQDNVRSTLDCVLPIEENTYFFKFFMYPYDGMVLCQYRDTTERNIRKLALEKRDKELGEIQKAAYIGNWRYVSDRRVLIYSGYTNIMCTEEEQEISLDTYLEIIIPDDRMNFKTWLEQNLTNDNDTEKNIDYRINYQGKIHYIRLKIFNREQEDDTITLEGYIQNITDIQQSRNDVCLLTHAIDNSTEDIYAAREDGTLIFANHSFKEHCGISNMDDISQMKIYELPHCIQNRESWQTFVSNVRMGRLTQTHVIYSPLTCFPEVLAMERNSYWVTSDEGIATIWSFMRDVTSKEIMKRELINAKEKAEVSDQLKSAFLANMSHEIRTPLNAIVGFSRIIADSENPDDRLTYYNIIETNNTRLLQLINEILDLSKLEAGMVELSTDGVQLNSLFVELHDNYRTRCPKNIEFVYDPSDESIVIVSDRYRLYQVISNMLENAFKFTNNGSIHYGYNVKGNYIECYVKDTGIGIAPDKIGHIFERFVKANDFSQGTGLGLSICKAIIERLGGKVSVASTLGQGTTFTFTLPLYLPS